MSINPGLILYSAKIYKKKSLKSETLLRYVTTHMIITCGSNISGLDAVAFCRTVKYFKQTICSDLRGKSCKVFHYELFKELSLKSLFCPQARGAYSKLYAFLGG